jgi:hypothetical protein
VEQVHAGARRAPLAEGEGEAGWLPTGKEMFEQMREGRFSLDDVFKM